MTCALESHVLGCTSLAASPPDLSPATKLGLQGKIVLNVKVMKGG